MALGASLSDSDSIAKRLSRVIEATYGRPALLFTDSGTSALRYALQLASLNATLVAVPGFGCIDVGAAAQGAGHQIIAYDLDPATLSPDPDSVERALRRGAKVVVASHLFGLAIRMTEVASSCERYGATLIEDAAQAFGARKGNRFVRWRDQLTTAVDAIRHWPCRAA